MPNLQRTCPTCRRAFVGSENAVCPDCSSDEHSATGIFFETMDLDAAAAGTPVDSIQESQVASPGDILDVYKVQKLLGRGGMAWVFLAQHTNLRRPCALKVLCPELQGRQRDSVELFMAEARAAASVVHQHIVTVHNIGEAEGRHFIELEYVAGRPLDDILADEPLSALQTADLMSQASSALSAAHDQGLVHRDFKPANIMVRPDGLAKLADFGLAKSLDDVAGRARLAGTPYYMAPELFQGEAATPASDVYAVGVSLFQMLTQNYPFDHPKWTELAKLHVDAPAPDVRRTHPHVDDALAVLVDQCLSKSVRDRPDNGAALAEELQAVFRSLRDLKAFLEEAFEGDERVSMKRDGEAFQLRVSLPDSRSQLVLVEESTTEIASIPLVRIISLCAPVDESYLRRALELNARIPHGALSIQDYAGIPHFVMVNSYPRATCDVEELRHSVLDVARWADKVESALTGDDRF